MDARAEIQYEIYIKTINIEALTMIEMSRRQLLPAIISYRSQLASGIAAIQTVEQDASVEKSLFAEISAGLMSFSKHLIELEKALEQAAAMHSADTEVQAKAYRDYVFAAMNTLREDADSLEMMIDRKYWPLPSYSAMLFNI